MRPLWTKVADYAHRYNGTHFQALAFHTGHHHPEGLLPALPGPPQHGWSLLGDFDHTPVRDQGTFKTLKLAIAYANTIFQDLQDNMLRTGKTAEEVRAAIATIRDANDETHRRKVYRQSLGARTTPPKNTSSNLFNTR